MTPNNCRRILWMMLLLIHEICSAQVSELDAIVQNIQGSFTKVETGNRSFQQQIRILQNATLLFECVEADQKGSTTNYQYEFNLSDIDPYTVRQQTQKDIMLVMLSVRNKQKLIKATKNGAGQGYEDELRIHVADVDQARKIIDLVKNGIPPAEKITTGKLKLTSYAEMEQWLIANIVNTTSGERSVEQKLTRESLPGSFRLLQIESDGKSAHRKEFVLNLVDININTLAFKISNNMLQLKFDMSYNLKSITYYLDGEMKPFVDELSIFANNVDEARDIKTVLTLAVPLAAAREKVAWPPLGTLNESLVFMTAFVKDVVVNTDAIAQKISQGCPTVLSRAEQSNGKIERGTWQFNWIDVNPNASLLKASGEKMWMEVKLMEKRKNVMISKNEEPAGFDDEVKIFVGNIEDGRRLRYGLSRVIEQCKQNHKDPFEDNVNAMTSWLLNTINDSGAGQQAIKQTLALVEPQNVNKFKLVQIESKGSSSNELTFEFNLSDINPISVDFETKGKQIFVHLETNFKAKIINAYKDGKIQPFVNELEVAMPDIETARNTISALQKSIRILKSKS